jgi:large subunit ribosomal protein L14e
MYQIGRLCVKLAGRDARKKCVIIDVLDNNFVMIDGQTRRKKCNIRHLEPLDKVLKIKKIC